MKKMTTQPKPDSKIKELEEELQKANLRADNEFALHERTKGKLEKYEEQEQREREERDRTMVRAERRIEDLQDQTQWLRHLIEDLCIPKEKMEMLIKSRNETTMRDPDFLPKFNRRY